MKSFFSPGHGAGAYLTGPIMPNPALLGYSASQRLTPTRPLSFPQTTASIAYEPDFSDQAVAEAIERLTKSPGSSPEALQQAALDMELVISHFDSLSAVFGAEAALTSLALDLATSAAEDERAEQATQQSPRRKTRRTSTSARRQVAKVS